MDTVFVVADHIDHSLRNYRDRLQGHVSPTYDAVTLAPWYGNTVERDKSHRLYSGATFETRVEDMFSFVPCLPVGKHPRGFARPTIRIPGVIADTLNQGKKINSVESTADIRRVWDEVVRQLTEQGLMLGIEAALPRPALPLQG